MKTSPRTARHPGKRRDRTWPSLLALLRRRVKEQMNKRRTDDEFANITRPSACPEFEQLSQQYQGDGHSRGLEVESHLAVVTERLGKRVSEAGAAVLGR